MFPRFAPLFTLLALVACHTPARGLAKDEPQVPLADHTPPAASQKLHKGRMPADAEITLRIVLHSRASEDADAYARNVTDPEHALYGKTLTPEQYMEKFGPHPSAVEAACAHLEKHGLEIDRLHGHVLHVKGRAANIESAFETELHQFEGKAGTEHYPVETPRAPKSTGIKAVYGLGTPAARRTHTAYLPHRAAYGYTGNDIRKAYEVPDSAQGAGQVMGLLELDSYDPADIARYAKDNQMRLVPLNNVLVGGYDGQIMDSGAQGEVTLDIELMNAIAPGAKEMRVYMASQANNGFFEMLNEIANPTLGDKMLVKSISCSWGSPEDAMSVADVKAESTLYRQMAIQGQSFFVAAGDDGARDDGRTLSTDDPASQVYTVAVGGTALYTNADGTYNHEAAWQNGGGGISRYWGIPPWQLNAIAPKSLASTRRRNLPDVSMNADPNTGFAIYVQGGYTTVGGTSCAAPLWAAVWSLAQEARVNAKQAPLGYFNSVFYPLMQTAAGKAAMHDILDNSTNGYFPSVPGRDNATGFGSPRVGPLLQALTAQ